MSFLPRKLTFQLTPLLDLLLIVIFAQYMEMRETTTATAATANVEASNQQDELQQQIEKQAADIRELKDRLSNTELADDAVGKLKRKNKELAEALQLEREKQKRIGDTIAEVFQLPKPLVERAFDPRNPEAKDRSPEELEKLRQAFRNIAEKRGREVLKHLLTYEELRKRCDVWEVHLDDDDTIVFHSGKNTHRFPATSSREFADTLFARYKSLPEPKSLVIILFSYGNATAGARKLVLDGLSPALKEMREDRVGRTQFGYAILGFHPPSDDSDK
jgi:hypothetical protein